MSEYTTITRKLERRRTVISFIASVLIHLLLLLIAVSVSLMNPEWFERPEPEPDEPIEFTMLPPPEPEPEEKMFVDSSQTEATDAPPPDAAFESDENSIAASERPPMDQTPVPTTEGEEEQSFQLRDQMLTLGPAPMPQPPQPETPEQRTEISPDVLPSEPLPTPIPTATATPEPTPEEVPEVPMPEQSDIQLLDPEEEPTPTPTPEPTPTPTPTPRETPEPEVRRAEAPTKPSSPIAPGYQPESRTTRLTGGISNKGRASVAAEATPLGKYRKMLSDAIGSRWYYYVADLIDLVNIGTVEIRFVVRSDGSVEGVRVLKNSSNESLASVSVRAVIEAEIPPIPPEVVQELEDGRLEVDYSFTIVGR